MVARCVEFDADGIRVRPDFEKRMIVLGEYDYGLTIESAEQAASLIEAISLAADQIDWTVRSDG